jgi:anti-anti-sigma factor
LAIQRRLIEAVEVTDNQIHLIRLKGIFDASTVGEFEKVVSYLLARKFFKMIIDLRLVEFISSAGWGAFTAELRRVRENAGDIKLSGMSTDVFDVFLLLELDHFINAYDAEEEAITAFQQPAPSIAHEIKDPAEVTAAPIVTGRKVMPAEEKSKTRLTAVYEATPPRIFEQPRAGEFEYQETHAVESETFKTESEVSAVARGNENYFGDQDKYDIDDTFEIRANPPMPASSSEMHELLLTREKPVLTPTLAKRSLPPPELTTSQDNFHEADVSGSNSDQLYHDDFGAITEFGYYEHEPTLDDRADTETHELKLNSISDPDFSQRAPISEAANDTADFSEVRTDAESNFSATTSVNFSRDDSKAFSELSLDLKSHLQKPERSVEKRNTSAGFHQQRPETKNEFSTRRNDNETQALSPPAFSQESEFSENTFDDHENSNAKFSETLEGKSAFSKLPPAFDDGNETQDLAAPLFSTSLNGFSQSAYSPVYNTAHENDNEFEAQDIRDPWILEEIDTLPEEDEVDEVVADDNERPIAASEFLSGSFEVELELPVLAPENETAHSSASLSTTNELVLETSPTAMFSDDLGAGLNEAETMPNVSTIHEDWAAGNEEKFSKKTRSDGKSKPVSAPIPPENFIKIPMSDDIVEMIHGIIAAYPDYGPNLICKFLEEHVEPPVFLSRSTVYRYLREANLNTRKRRFEYAGQEI